MKFKFLNITLVSLVLTVSGFANAGLIIASGDSNINTSPNSQLFNSLFGGNDVIGRNGSSETWATNNWASFATGSALSYSSTSSISSPLSADWVILGSGTGLTATEFSFLDTFMNNGGNLWVVGEASTYNSINAVATSVLTHFNTGMSISLAGISTIGNASPEALSLGGGANFQVNFSSYISGGTALYSDNNGAIVSVSSFNTTSVPEPSTLAIFALGMMGLVSRRFKKKS